MLCGLTGSGKTTLAHTLEKEQSAVCFSIDRWMIELYGHHMSREDFDKRKGWRILSDLSGKL
ncbi:MAG: ATP-binding protein [Leptolyngbyaceae cyanobacterium SM1_1_3]|nr:ATP-binding protein [Leptolyngbyaceae cyanobacterium SM1_1_3]NJO11329.1 ATP-binding protein [Leptolyngbyaceae cyanobacterium SL_1_1]